MLRVWKASGEELVAIPAEEVNDVQRLKFHLRNATDLRNYVLVI